MRCFLAALLLLSLPAGAQPATAPLPPSTVIGALDSALYLMRTHSLYAGQLNWARIADSTHYKARHAQTLNDALPALTYAFDQLRDYHGLAATGQGSHHLAPPTDPGLRLSAGIRQEYLKGPRIGTAQLTPAVAYLRVPAMLGTQPATVTRWTTALRDSLGRVLARRPTALVLDLRMNNGGNLAPMLAGLAALLGDGPHAYLADRARRLTGTYALRRGVFTEESAPVRRPASAWQSLPLPVAVLLGPATGSSGEILAMVLRARSRTRSFGEATAGQCNSTEGFLFGANQGYLLLTTNYVADSRGQVQTAPQLQPDVAVSSTHDDFSRPLADPTVQAALAWLATPAGHR